MPCIRKTKCLPILSFWMIEFQRNRSPQIWAAKPHIGNPLPSLKSYQRNLVSSACRCAGNLNPGQEGACVKAKVPTWTPRQLRHNVATSVAESIDLDSARALLSHTNLSMTERYVHRKQDEAKAIEAAHAAPRVC